MKKTIRNLLVMMMAFVVVLSFSSCSKDEKAKDDTVISSEATDSAAKETDAQEIFAEEPDEKAEETKPTAEEAVPAKEEQKTPETTPVKEPVPSEKESASQQTSSETASYDEETSEVQTNPAPAPVDLKSVAMSYKGKSAASLAQAIGQPSSKSYASSCIGDGEDGEWYYNGFTVYTYRDTDGSERVEDVF